MKQIIRFFSLVKNDYSWILRIIHTLRLHCTTIHARFIFIALHTVSIFSVYDDLTKIIPSVSSDECLHRNKLLEAAILDYSFIRRKMMHDEQEILAHSLSQIITCDRSSLTQQKQRQHIHTLQPMEADNYKAEVELLFRDVFFVH